jgi:hypothetical protein
MLGACMSSAGCMVIAQALNSLLSKDGAFVVTTQNCTMERRSIITVWCNYKILKGLFAISPHSTKKKACMVQHIFTNSHREIIQGWIAHGREVGELGSCLESHRSESGVCVQIVLFLWTSSLRNLSFVILRWTVQRVLPFLSVRPSS